MLPPLKDWLLTLDFGAMFCDSFCLHFGSRPFWLYPCGLPMTLLFRLFRGKTRPALELFLLLFSLVVPFSMSAAIACAIAKASSHFYDHTHVAHRTMSDASPWTQTAPRRSRGGAPLLRALLATALVVIARLIAQSVLTAAAAAAAWAATAAAAPSPAVFVAALSCGLELPGRSKPNFLSVVVVADANYTVFQGFGGRAAESDNTITPVTTPFVTI